MNDELSDCAAVSLAMLAPVLVVSLPQSIAGRAKLARYTLTRALITGGGALLHPRLYSGRPYRACVLTRESGARIQGLQRQQGHQGRTLPARQRTLTRNGDVPGRLRRS